MKKILNTMQHALQSVQLNELAEIYGANILVDYLSTVNPGLFAELSNCPANTDRLEALAIELCSVIKNENYEAVILPIGSPAFMFIFAKRANTMSANCLFAHSIRQSVERTNADGTVTKTQVFNHLKFIEFVS